MKAELSVSRFVTMAVFMLVAGLAFSEPAYAQGLTSVNTFLQNVIMILKGAGIAIVTVAIMWVGYKMLFKGAAFSEVATVFVGALLIGGAATIAGYLIPA